MNITQIAVVIFFVEVVICIASVLALLIMQSSSLRAKQKRVLVQKKFTKILQELVEQKREIKLEELGLERHQPQDILVVLEEFNERFTDDFWENLKQSILEEFLRPLFLSWSESSSWQRRNIAGRCIALKPYPEDEERISALIHDPEYLVRMPAVASAVKLKSERVIKEILKRAVSDETNISIYPYRDALLFGGADILDIILKFLQEESDPKIRAFCLELFSLKVYPNLLPIISSDLSSEYPEVRLAAVKVLSNIPGEESEKLLKHALNDQNQEVLRTAAQAAGKIKAKSCIPQLRKLLNNKEWSVRMQAAMTLKELGKDGRLILVQQDAELSPEAYDVAHYVLKLP